MGKTPYVRRFADPLKGSIIPFGAMVEYQDDFSERFIKTISARDLSRIHQFGKKVLPRIFLGYELIAVKIWKGDILITDLEDSEKLDASENYTRRINAKEVLISLKGEDFKFPVADGTARL